LENLTAYLPSRLPMNSSTPAITLTIESRGSGLTQKMYKTTPKMPSSMTVVTEGINNKIKRLNVWLTAIGILNTSYSRYISIVDCLTLSFQFKYERGIKILSRMFTSCTFPCVMIIVAGILPRISKSVCNFIAPLRFLNFAHGNSDRHKSIVVASNA